MHLIIIQNVEAANRFEAIEAAASTFIKEGYVTADFTQAVCEREREFPTGLPTKIGVAIPHTEAEYVLEEAICITVLKDPVIFYDMGDPKEEVKTSILFLLAIKNGEEQINWLQKIVLTIQDEMVLHKIIGAKNKETIYNLMMQE